MRVTRKSLTFSKFGMAWRSYSQLSNSSAGPEVLVVTFASAPGVPNWGGVLGKLAREASPEERQFDVLFVCDGGRNWYSGTPLAPQSHLLLATF